MRMSANAADAAQPTVVILAVPFSAQAAILKTALLISLNRRYKVRHSGIRITGLGQ